MNRGVKIFLQYSITTVTAGLAATGILFLRKFPEATTDLDKCRILSEALTVPGVVLLILAALIWISSDGFFDAFFYNLRRMGHMLIPFYGRRIPYRGFYTYKAERAARRPKHYAFLFFVGLAFAVAGVVFIVLHEKMYDPAMMMLLPRFL